MLSCVVVVVTTGVVDVCVGDKVTDKSDTDIGVVLIVVFDKVVVINGVVENVDFSVIVDTFSGVGDATAELCIAVVVVDVSSVNHVDAVQILFHGVHKMHTQNAL